jgi:hypothetical protein
MRGGDSDEVAGGAWEGARHVCGGCHVRGQTALGG